jgi:hypothetical protein
MHDGGVGMDSNFVENQMVFIKTDKTGQLNLKFLKKWEIFK